MNHASRILALAASLMPEGMSVVVDPTPSPAEYQLPPAPKPKRARPVGPAHPPTSKLRVCGHWGRR